MGHLRAMRGKGPHSILSGIGVEMTHLQPRGPELCSAGDLQSRYTFYEDFTWYLGWIFFPASKSLSLEKYLPRAAVVCDNKGLNKPHKILRVLFTGVIGNKISPCPTGKIKQHCGGLPVCLNGTMDWGRRVLSPVLLSPLLTC